MPHTCNNRNFLYLMLSLFQKDLFKTGCLSFNKNIMKKSLYPSPVQLQGINSFHRFVIWDIVVQRAKYTIYHYHEILCNYYKFLIAFAQ